MAEASKGGESRSARASFASTRPKASAKGRRTVPARLIRVSMACRASGTEIMGALPAYDAALGWPRKDRPAGPDAGSGRLQTPGPHHTAPPSHLLVSHSADEMVALCDEVLVFDAGSGRLQTPGPHHTAPPSHLRYDSPAASE